MIVFTQDNAEAIGLEQVATVSGEPITSRILEVVRSSTALGSAFKDMFAKVFGGKKIAFIVILCVVAIVVVLVFSGQLKIKLWSKDELWWRISSTITRNGERGK